MKTTSFAATVLVATLVLSAGSALAARKSATVEGILGKSTEGKSMLKETKESDKGYFFDPSSEAGKKILAVCQSGKMCVVRGIISGKNILNAYYVKVGE